MHTKKILITLILLLSLSFLLIGCSFGTNDNVDSVKISDSYKELIIGDTFTLTATVLLKDETKTDTDLSVSWATSKSSVASIDENGKITAKAGGKTTITVKAKANAQKTASCEITVIDPNAPLKNAGEYRVGTDIEEGEYLLITDIQDNGILSLGYLEVKRTPNAAIGSDDYLYNDNFYYRAYVSLKDGEYIKFSKSKLYKISSITVDKNAESWTSGQYKVGRDLDAGSYLLTTWSNESITDRGYVEFTLTPNGKIGTSNFISNDNFENTKYIDLIEGQYVKIKKATLTKVS